MSTKFLNWSETPGPNPSTEMIPTSQVDAINRTPRPPRENCSFHPLCCLGLFSDTEAPSPQCTEPYPLSGRFGITEIFTLNSNCSMCPSIPSKFWTSWGRSLYLATVPSPVLTYMSPGNGVQWLYMESMKSRCRCPLAFLAQYLGHCRYSV